MPNVLVDLIKEWKAIQSKFEGYSKDFYVFGLDEPVADSTLQNKHLKYTREAQIRGYDVPRIPIHGFRHSHASFLINNMSTSFTDFDIAKRLGDTVETLHNTYFHWFQSGDQSIVDFMNNV